MAQVDLVEPLAQVNGVRVISAEVKASLDIPWRIATIVGNPMDTPVEVKAGYRTSQLWTVFNGAIDNPEIRNGTLATSVARGLPALRKVLEPQGFQDATLEVVIKWVALKVGLTLSLNIKGDRRRHYLVSQGTALQALRQALRAWGKTDAVLVELDAETLYIGPEEESPFATESVATKLQDSSGLIRLEQISATVWRATMPACPWLRVGHRLSLDHPRKSGKVRIVEICTSFRSNHTLSYIDVEDA